MFDTQLLRVLEVIRMLHPLSLLPQLCQNGVAPAGWCTADVIKGLVVDLARLFEEGDSKKNILQRKKVQAQSFEKIYCQ